MIVYIAGPMGGKPRYNFDAFLAAATSLRSLGVEVISPAEIALSDGFNPDSVEPVSADQYEKWMIRGLASIQLSDAVWLLTGWRMSSGALREYRHALLHRKMILGAEL
jgi:hypothetical protein